VEIGANESQRPASGISYAWFQQFGLPAEGSADFIDTDSNHINTQAEWRSGTSPLDPASLLKMLLWWC